MLPREARPLDRQAEMRFAAAVVAGMAVMLRAVVAEGEIRIGKSGGKQPFHLALHWTFFAHAPMLARTEPHDQPPIPSFSRPSSARSRLRRTGTPRASPLPPAPHRPPPRLQARPL